MPSVRVSVSEAFSNGPSTMSDPPPDQHQVCFTRQLWQRTMPVDVDDLDSPSLYRGQRVSIGSNISRKDFVATSPSIAQQSHLSPHQPSETPLTPEESPPFKHAQKRSLDQIDEDEEQTTPSRSRESSDGSFQPCLCQPEPKVPRPRNGKLTDHGLQDIAFLYHTYLYRLYSWTFD